MDPHIQPGFFFLVFLILFSGVFMLYAGIGISDPSAVYSPPNQFFSGSFLNTFLSVISCEEHEKALVLVFSVKIFVELPWSPLYIFRPI